MKLIVLSAGLGKRFLPTTGTIPKGMIPLLGKPLLKHVLEPYLNHVSDIILVINNSLGLQIKDYFGESYCGHKVFYKIQNEQKGTMDALLICKDLMEANEIFCAVNGDDLLRESDIKNAVEQNMLGLGISKKIMPKNYLGINIENGRVAGFRRHDERNKNVEDMYYNGFNILDSKVFEFEPVATADGELGLPHTLFANIDTYPLKAFIFKEWETVNKPEDMDGAIKFIQNGK